jgi:MurNAc alpha-1-phosphate uridylyltransferase
MKAMLLAAGKGERMRPLTLEHPKPLLPVGGKALIDWHLERLVDAGIDDIVMNVSWLGDQIQAHCGNGERWGVRIRYSVEDEPLETAGGIVQALPLLGEAPFLVLNADIFTDFPFAAISGSPGLPDEAWAKLVLVPNPSHNRAGDFSLHGARVVERAADALTYAGIGLYHPAFFAGCAPGKRPMLPLVLRAIAEHRLRGERFAGVWTDVGTPERLQALNASLAATDH